jgi:hypothetical protein
MAEAAGFVLRTDPEALLLPRPRCGLLVAWSGLAASHGAFRRLGGDHAFDMPVYHPASQSSGRFPVDVGVC